jgi:hypothetical protein
MRTEIEYKNIKSALDYIIPLLEKHKFQYVITGGFACYVYGVDRLLTDIDIDINTSVDSDEFRRLLEEVKPFITQELINYIDNNYNNFNLELTVSGIVIDICPMDELLSYDSKLNKFTKYYSDGFPEIEQVNYAGYTLPLLSKSSIIENNLNQPSPDKWRIRDALELQKLIDLS